MNLLDYQTFVNNVRLQSADEAYAMLGLIGEIGELYGYLAKSVRDGYEPDMEHVKKELGDVLWFIAAISKDIGSDLEQVAALNVAKLTSRKAAGKLQGSGEELADRH